MGKLIELGVLWGVFPAEQAVLTRWRMKGGPLLCGLLATSYSTFITFSNYF